MAGKMTFRAGGGAGRNRAAPAPAAPDPATVGEKRLAVVALGLAIGYLAALGLLLARGGWIIDTRGRPLLTDFIAVWSAGRLALTGAGASAYNGALQHAAEVAALGHGFHGEYGWPYPPSFLFVAEALARLPYGWGFAAMLGASLSLYGLGVAAVTRRAWGAVVAVAAPWTLACALVGQNGFLTAGLFALVLLTLDRRPIMSGLLLGLLAYKPQFGLLFPLALAVSGRWRAFAAAAITVAVVTGLAAEAFGVDALMGFLQAMPRTTQTLVTDGGVGWGRLQSVYGLMRCLGATSAAGWAAQAVTAALCAVAVAGVWRGRAPFELKAASLVAAAALCTPYIFAYDLPLLSVAAAFLYRHRRFDGADYAALAIAGLAMVPILFVALPFGLIASLAMAAMAARRVTQAMAPGRPALDPGVPLGERLPTLE